MVSPGHDANWLFLIALIHVGFVGNPAAAWRYQISSGWVLSLYMLWTASLGGDLSGRYSVGGFVVKTVSVFSFRTVGTKGTCYSFAVLSYQTHKIARHVTNIFVSLSLYMLISWSLNTVMYPASAVLGMLRKEFLVIDGTRWMSFAGWRMLKGSSLMESAAVRVLLGS